MNAPLKITNAQARALWLTSQGLGVAPVGKLDLRAQIERLGFVQLDTIQVVSRAHHHILWSRNQNYREPMLDRALRGRDIFEHFTHDASVIPMRFLPMWQRQFRRKEERIRRSSWFSSMLGEAERAAIKDRIAKEGALSTHAFDTKIEGEKKMWARPPHKLALDFMWFSGELATCHRKNFTKFYDLGERVFPAFEPMEDRTQIDALCGAALDRIGFGNLSEIRKFWDATSVAEVKAWSSRADLVPVEVECFDGSWREAVAPPDIENRIAAAAISSRLRILNPFDPVIRDRARLERLFGFEYRVEMFVPAAKRKWGYYVFPLLEGARFVGRVEVKADRAKGRLNVIQFWPEADVKWGPKRMAKLDAELQRLGRLAGVKLS